MKSRKLFLSAVSIAALVTTAFVGCTTVEPDDNKKPDGDTPQVQAPYADLNVTVEGGDIQGFENGDKDMAIFRGIPYAAAPVGDLRFKSPQAVTPWEGTLDCTKWGANSLQNTPNTTGGLWTAEFHMDLDASHYRGGEVFSEDCLFLNVWSSYAVTENKPVLVFIHGGAYNTGGTSGEVFDGEAIAKRDVVYVSIQYRVGSLGYMATKNLEAEKDGAGNYGLLDQVAALKWVQNNIKEFGGDPENVTVMGQSAGAGSISGLISTKRAEGLFNNAVSLSAEYYGDTLPSMSDRISKTSGSYDGKAFTAMTGEELRNVPASFFKGRDLNPAGPCIDGEIITGTYKSTIGKRVANPVTLMTGNVSLDDEVFPDAYISNDSITKPECMIGQQTALAAARKKMNTNGNTYVYMFDYDVPMATTGNEKAGGAQHSYELYYFLGNFVTVSGRSWTDADYALGEKMMGYLLNFCKTADPNGDGLAEWTNNAGDRHYMNFASTVEAKQLEESKQEIVNKHYKY